MSGKELINDGQLSIAMLNNVKVIVRWKDDQNIADYGGQIEEVIDHAVKINGMYYTKAACRFYIR